MVYVKILVQKKSVNKPLEFVVKKEIVGHWKINVHLDLWANETPKPLNFFRPKVEWSS